MRIAIVGAGISGLAAAWRLQRSHDVTLFETSRLAGGHTHTHDVIVDGARFAVDTGFIVFNHDHYPLFTRLLSELDVASQPTDMSFSVRSDRSGVEYCSRSFDTVFAQRRNLVRPAFLRMLGDIRRFLRSARQSDLPGDDVTVQEYVDRERYGPAFVDEYLVPLGASLWSSPPSAFRAFSMRFVIEFLRNHALLQLAGQPVWRVIRGGSHTYVKALLARLAGPVMLGRSIRGVERLADRVVLADDRGDRATFDHVVLACHADQALRLLVDASPIEREILAAFPYQRNNVLLHTDTSVLPRNRRAWASWNYHVPATDRAAVSVTYDMNRLQGIDAPVRFNVTLNDAGLVRDDRVLARFVYEHPEFRPGREAAQRRHHELIGVNRTSFCGAYWGYGFHEDGVRSGYTVVDALEKRRAA